MIVIARESSRMTVILRWQCRCTEKTSDKQISADSGDIEPVDWVRHNVYRTPMFKSNRVLQYRQYLAYEYPLMNHGCCVESAFIPHLMLNLLNTDPLASD